MKKYLLQDTIEENKTGDTKYKIDYLFYSGRKWRQDCLYFDSKKELLEKYDKTRTKFGNKCLIK